MNAKPLTHWLLLTGICLLSFYLFSHHLDATSLWADEGWTIAASAEANPVQVVDRWVAVDVHPPLFFVALNLWRQFTGDSIFELRYFSVLVSLIGVALMYRLGRAMYSVRAGYLAAFLFGVHDLVIVLTHEVRHYPAQQTMSALTLWLYWRFWQRPTRQRGIAFAVGGAALLYTHYWGALVLLGIGLHMLITRWRTLKPYMVASVGVGLLYVPWLPVIAHQMTTERPEGLPHALENSWTVYKTIAYQVVGIPELFWLTVAVVGTLGLLSIPRRPSPAGILPMLVIVVTVGVSIALNSRYPSLSFRSVAVIIPALLALVGGTVAQFRPREQGVVVAFIVVQSLAITGAQPLQRPPWPEVGRMIAEHSTSDDVTVLDVDTDKEALQYYLEYSGATVRWMAYDDLRVDEATTGLWLAKFGYFGLDKFGNPGAVDSRPLIEALGFIPTAPAIEWPLYPDGRPIALYRYDRPPQSDPLTRYGAVLDLMRATVAIHEQEVVVNLLWRPVLGLDTNYTVSAFLLTEDGRLAVPSHDSYPLEGESPTVDWEAGGYYFDSHRLDKPMAGRYQVGVKVYYFTTGDGSQLEIVPLADCATNCDYFVVDSIKID
ncbi:MAG: glycosyltransferase family 39 protein [Anaerolineales bacterium]|nr:glycosyltransferase family 39 protein [Anaerolineales bacterium]